MILSKVNGICGDLLGAVPEGFGERRGEGCDLREFLEGQMRQFLAIGLEKVKKKYTLANNTHR